MTDEGTGGSQENFSKYVEQKSEAELVRFLLDQEEVIEIKLMYYKGFIYNTENDKFIRISAPMLNEEGIQFASRNFRRFLNKNSATANLDGKQVEALVMSFSSAVRKNILQNLKRFGINSISTVDEIKNDISDMAHVLLSQSVDDKGRTFIHTPRRMTEVHTINPPVAEKKRLIPW